MDKEIKRDLECPVCGSKEMTLQKFRSVKTEVFVCQSCQHRLLISSEKSSAPVSSKAGQYSLLKGAGVDFMVYSLLLCEDVRSAKSLLEVGCGVGFSLDFARTYLKMDVVGIEPAPYYEVAKNVFNLEVYNSYLENTPEILKRRFDLVFSSEVIEHVENPGEFLRIVRLVSDKLALTTPNGEILQNLKALNRAQINNMLDPGEHLRLYSKASLKLELEKAGFKDVYVIEHPLNPARLFASAGMSAPSHLNAQKYRDIYINYLQTRIKSASDSMLKLGLLWRLFKELVNLGSYQVAAEVLKQLLEALKENDLTRANQELLFPPCAIYYKGMMELNTGMIVKAAESFKIATKLLKRAISKYPFDEEYADLFLMAKYHYALSLERLGKKAKAKAIYLSLLFNKPPLELRTRVISNLRS